ncbi:TlpA disulfide reductase family protein [Pedobacter sp. L105]|uniref:TlpA family protein disulfide reductase n=1 Tax=Pedobacter sp. L105 TaxID=1641871 RepID=UPI00131E9A38|nr:TlpA disulfide reductase family protein [Pedobacter sp. L105]
MKTNYIATGGKEQTLQTQLDQLERKYERVYLSAYDSVTRKLYVDSIQRSRLVKVFNVANDAFMNIYVSFGKKHIDSYLGLDIIYRNRNSIPKDSVVLLYKALPAFLKNTGNAVALKVFISENLVKKGDHFKDFQVLDIQGKPFKLSALKDKYIYLTFGSLGCGPCRMENKEISKNYDSLSKNVALVNFSLDVNKVEWEAAAKADGIIWYNVSDMAGMSGKIKTLYGVQAMPTSFLIDKNGIIVEKFDGYSPDNFKEVERIVSNPHVL